MDDAKKYEAEAERLVDDVANLIGGPIGTRLEAIQRVKTALRCAYQAGSDDQFDQQAAAMFAQAEWPLLSSSNEDKADMSNLIGEQPDGKPPQRVLDEWMRKVGPSIIDPTMPRYWFWNGTKVFNSFEDMVDD